MDGVALHGEEDETSGYDDTLQGLTPTISSETTGERARVTKAERQTLRSSLPEQLVEMCEGRLDKHLWLWLLAFRIVNALVTSRSQFAPDEHWQSLEISHKIVFGYGWPTWEWIDRRPQSEHIFGSHWGDGPIRSVIYPALFVPIYGLLRLLRLGDVTLLRDMLPSLLQSVFAATCDWYMFLLARRVLNERAAWASLLCSLCSMYTFHSSTRTLSNSTEAALTAAALFYWPLSLPEASETELIREKPLIENDALFKALALFAASAALRPSNVLFSLPLFVLLLRQITLNIKSPATAIEALFAILIVLRSAIMVAVVSAASLFLLDSVYYGRLTFTPLDFLKRNVLQGISLFYGASPFHFYLTSALPFLGFTTLPFMLRGLWFAFHRPPVSAFDKHTRRWTGYRGEQDPTAVKTLADAILIFVLGMSLLGHKEVRFLQPILPVLHIMQGYALVLLPPFRDPTWIPLLGSLKQWRRRSRTQGRRQYRPSYAYSEDGQAALARQAQQERARRAELLQALTNFTSWQGRHHLLPRTPAWFSLSYEWEKMCDTAQFMRIWHGKYVLRLLALNIIPIVYLALHSTGQIRVAEYVGQLGRAGELDSVGYLMPCHSTPWMSHMHDKELAQFGPISQGRAVRRAWFVTCEPPLSEHGKQGIASYRDESDDFYEDPLMFLQERLGTDDRPWPSHLVLFEALLSASSPDATANKLPGEAGSPDSVAALLSSKGYELKRSFWNSLFHLDKRRRGKVLLMQRRHSRRRTGPS